MERRFQDKSYAYHTERVHSQRGKFLRDLVLGLNDGMVASFAVTSGVSAAATTSVVVIVAGLAESVGGALSMGLAAFASAKAEQEFYRSEMEREEEEIRRWPEEEREERRQIYREKGFEGALLEQVVNHITADRERWKNVMMREELGFAPETFVSPALAGFRVGVSYLVGALTPVLPYFILPPRPGVIWSALVALIALLAVGAGKAILTRRPVIRSALEAAIIGSIAAAATYVVGRVISTNYV